MEYIYILNGLILKAYSSLVLFQLSFEDAEIMHKNFAEKINLNALVQTGVLKAYVKILNFGMQLNPFSLVVTPMLLEPNSLFEISRFKAVSNRRYSICQKQVVRKIEKWLDML